MTDEQIEESRYLLDTAIDKWLEYNGLTKEEIAELDYSSLDDELHYLLQYAQSKRSTRLKYLQEKQEVAGLDKAELYELQQLLRSK